MSGRRGDHKWKCLQLKLFKYEPKQILWETVKSQRVDETSAQRERASIKQPPMYTPAVAYKLPYSSYTNYYIMLFHIAGCLYILMPSQKKNQNLSNLSS